MVFDKRFVSLAAAGALVVSGALAFAPAGGLVQPKQAQAAAKMKVTSPAVKNGKIAKKYGYQNGNVSLPLTVKKIPKKAKYLAIYMYDVTHGSWVHWLATDLSTGGAAKKKIVAGASKKWSSKMVQGTSTYGELGYEGPWPPQTHTYSITVYALKAKTGLSSGYSYSDFQKAVKGKVVQKRTIKGKYTHTN